MNRKAALVVLVIIIIAVACVFEMKRRAEFRVNATANTKSKLELLEGGLGVFEADNGRFPSEKEGLPILFGLPIGEAYIKETSPWNPPTLDGWRKAILYEIRDGTAILRSAGPDGVYRSADDIYESVAPSKGAPGSADNVAKEIEVSATVTSQSGAPVRGAIVSVTYHSGPTFRGNTDADGKVSIKVPGDGYSSIHVRHEGGIWNFGRQGLRDIKNVALRLDDGNRVK